MTACDEHTCRKLNFRGFGNFSSHRIAFVAASENRSEVPDGDESIPSNEEIGQRMSVLMPAKSPDKEDL